MGKKYDVVWSKQSDNATDLIVRYLRTEFSEREVRNFLNRLRLFEKVVTKYPKSFPVSKFKKGFRRALISSQTSVIYKIDKNKIRVLTLFDNRRDPSTL